MFISLCSVEMKVLHHIYKDGKVLTVGGQTCKDVSIIEKDTIKCINRISKKLELFYNKETN